MQFSIKAISAIMAAITYVAPGVHADDGAIAPEDSHVVKLTEETFSEFIKTNPYVLAEFFAPWCGHCKRLGPELVSAAESLAESHPDIKLAQIDCTEEKDLCSNFEIRGYPTMKVFKGDEAAANDYPGQRTSDAIQSYMIKLTLPVVQALETAADVDSAIENVSDAVILQILPEGAEYAKSNETFYQVANRLSEKFVFVSTSDPKYVKEYSTSTEKPSYVIFRKGDSIEDASVYKGETIEDDFKLLVDFIDVESKPLFGEINGSTYQAYTSSNIPLAYYFYTSQEQRDDADVIIRELAKKYRGDINFVGLDATAYGMHAQNLNMQEDFPLFVIHDLAANKKYGIDQSKPLDNNDITQFVEKFKEGELEPIVKSEPIPETQDSAVYHLVGHEHDKIVKSDKDVLVKYYAPWCGHCKKLAPTFEELAELYEGKDVVIAKLDHTLNDVEGVEIQGYPTLVLFPADGSEPIYYENARSLEAMVEFIKEKGSLGVDGLSDDEVPSSTTAVVAEESTPEVAAEETVHDEL